MISTSSSENEIEKPSVSNENFKNEIIELFNFSRTITIEEIESHFRSSNKIFI